MTVVATNLNGYAATNNYQVVVPANSAVTPTYDLNGNLTNNGAGQTYAWDAKDELTQITYTSGATTSFTYDGLGRRVKIVEKNSGGTVTSTKQFVWLGNSMAEERDANDNVTKRFFAQGEQLSGTSYYYTRDHLSSIREMTDGSGNILARYDYDPYGRPTLVQGTNLADFQYAGYYEHQTSGLNLTKYRAYDPNTAKWLSRDPLKNAELRQRADLYAYVEDNPVRWTDPFGLAPCTCEEFQKEGNERAKEVANYIKIFGSLLAIPPEIAEELDRKYPCTASGSPTGVATVIEHVGPAFVPVFPELPGYETLIKIIEIILGG